MPHDDQVACRVRKALGLTPGLTEKKMSGGMAILLNGHMCCGVLERTLVLRPGNELAGQALREKHTRMMDFTGRPMKSMIYVEPQGFEDDTDLKRWVGLALEHARTLPPKSK